MSANATGGQDLGGKPGHGPVVIEAHEPVFHHDWERRAFALTLAMGATGEWNIDMGRSARENRPARDYLSMSYYRLWLAGLETLLAARGLATAQEIETGSAQTASRPVKRILEAQDVAATLARGGPCERPGDTPPLFATGSRVRTRPITHSGHTRLPGYAMDRQGVIHRHHGIFVFPDTNAAGMGEQPRHLYSVHFDARELWGAKAGARDGVFVDLWESYLEPA